MEKILISTSSFGASHVERIRAAGFDVELNPFGRKLDESEATQLLKDKVGVIAGVEKLSASVLEQSRGLRAISRCGVGMDSVDLSTAKRLEIAVRNTPNAHIEPVAELTLAGILTALRRIPVSDRSIRAGQWAKPMGTLLGGKTIGIVGLGRVGQRLVELMQPFRVKVLAHDPSPAVDFGLRHGIEWTEISGLFDRCDVICLHLPFTEDTRGLVGPSLLARLKPTALLVNTARGGVIDEPALAAFLRAHPKASAFLDVFEEEPYHGELRELDNAILTTHIGSYAAEGREAMEAEATQNLLEALGRA